MSAAVHDVKGRRIVTVRIFDGTIDPPIVRMEFSGDKLVLFAEANHAEFFLRDLKIELESMGTPFTDPHNFVEEGGGWGPVRELIFDLK